MGGTTTRTRRTSSLVCHRTSEALATVTSAPPPPPEPVIQDFPRDAHVMEGESVYYTVKVSGVPPPTITWYHEGKEVVSDYSTELKPDGTLHILSAESRHTGVYQMVAQNSAGSAEREVNVFVRVEGEATPALQKRAMEMKPVPVADFGQYVDENHSNNNRGFRDQYLVSRSWEGGGTAPW